MSGNDRPTGSVAGKDLPDRGHSSGVTGKDFVDEMDLARGFTRGSGRIADDDPTEGAARRGFLGPLGRNQR